ncbi:type III PLP-dependent enzyme [Rugosimonospora africana]|uniref:ornithine decarboxylase n=1 Tax=Rugosimonospora africana TaxID=556532 RepID=A0A8J3VUH6_9ACTN|nr:type III PLP-dependent enzyme [Rugosimonospora africana]GIH19285.1 ornithine decarboxylase [Rugosimonospora africana]
MMRTPALVMDLSVVEAAYRRFTTAMPSIAVHYAMKCNPHQDILTTLRSLGCRFEIASAPELDQLLALGVDPATVLYSNPIKPAAHIRDAYYGGVRSFAFDSLDEAAKLAALAPGSNVIVRLAALTTPSGVPSEGKFGVDPDTAVRLLAQARSLGLCPFGVTFHVGSQMLVPEAWRPPLVAVRRMMHQLADMGIFLQMVDLGGGFPAPYGAKPPPLERYAAVIENGLAGLPYPVRAVVEPGRALVAEAGTLTATVIGTAIRSGKRWIHLDAGAFNGFMESLETGNELRFPVSDSRGSAVRDRFQLTGPTCDSQDTILFDVELSADLSTGDLVHLGTAGAYTTAYASTFNGFEVPTVRCVSGSRLIEATVD